MGHKQQSEGTHDVTRKVESFPAKGTASAKPKAGGEIMCTGSYKVAIMLEHRMAVSQCETKKEEV